MTAGAMICGGLSSCKNADVEFPDSDGGINVFFSYQNPIRTIVLGDITTTDNSGDNEHRFSVYATMGGAYHGRNIDVQVDIDESLVNGLSFPDGTKPEALPSNYYTLSGKTISYNGKLQACIDVQLNDAFFNDTKAVEEHFVLPVVIKDVTAGYNILSGTPAQGGKNIRQNPADWIVAPKDYTLYMVNFINKYHGSYLRRGTDVITSGGSSKNVERKKEFIEWDEVVKLTTKSLNEDVITITGLVDNGEPVSCDLLLTFDNNNKCTISSLTPGYTATGTGEFKTKSEIKAWGDKDRDGLYLDYTINLGSTTYKTSDILVARDRGTVTSVREFDVSYKD